MNNVRRVVVVRHGESTFNAEIASLNIPTGRPFVYELDDQLRPLGRTYLCADPATSGGRQ